MDITPQQAAEFLKLNATNRPIRPSWVRTLCGIIERGEWVLTHQGIAITSENLLIDGQHRLQAIVNTGITVQMMVSFDCDPESFKVIDSGVKRSVQDQLRVPVAVGALARLVWRLPNHKSNNPATSQQIEHTLEWAKEPIEAVVHAVTKKTKFNSAPIQLAIVGHHMAGHSNVIGEFKAFYQLDFDSMPPAVKTLAKQIIDGKASARTDIWDLVARSWRAFTPGTETGKVQIKDSGVAIAELNRVLESYKTRFAKNRKG